MTTIALLAVNGVVAFAVVWLFYEGRDVLRMGVAGTLALTVFTSAITGEFISFVSLVAFTILIVGLVALLVAEIRELRSRKVRS